MYRRAGILALLAAASLSAGCAGVAAGPRSGDIGNAIVLDSEDLFDTRGNLLRVLSTRLVNSELVEVDGCSALTLRGQKSIFHPTLPGIYVEGQRTSGSCVLDMVNTEDVSRVEVYPSGITQRPGYYNHAGGLILVFLKDGSEAYAGR